MLASLGAALLVGYLPGALLYRLPFWNRPRRAALAAEERVFWAVLVAATWSVMLALTLALFDSYRFDRVLLANGALVALMAVAGNRRLLYRGEAPRPTASALVPAAIVAAGLAQLLPPAEYVMGGKDPGTYMNEGIQLAQRGGIIYRDPVVASVPEPFRDLFFRQAPVEEYFGSRFMGFFLQDPGTGSVIGQFPHGFPASIALAYGLNGLSGARQAVVFWSILGLVAVYLTASRVWGSFVAAAGTALLVVNVIEIWWGRYPNVEVASRALIFGSLLAFSRATDGDRPFFGAVSGALFGLPLFFRFDAVLTIGAAVGAAVLVVANRQRVGWAFGVSLAVTTAAGLWYLFGPLSAYSAPFLSIAMDNFAELAVAAAVALVVMRLVLARDRSAALVTRWLPIGMAATLVGLAGYAFFLRQPGGRLSVHDAMAFRTFAWYVTPIGVLLAVLGLAMSVRRLFWTAPAVFLTVAIHGVFFFYKTRIVPQHFWASRRWLTVVLPAAMMGVAALAYWLAQPETWMRRRNAPAAEVPHKTGTVGRGVAALIAAAALLPLGWAFWVVARPVRYHVEYAGLIPKLESIARAIGDRDLLIVESRGTGSDLHVLALPLAYIYDRQVLVLETRTPDKRRLTDFVRWAPSRYDRVLFMGGSGTDLLSKALSAEPLGEVQFWVPEYDSPANAYPTEVTLKEFEYGLYHLRADAPRRAEPIDLSIGTLGALRVRRFFTPETHASGFLFRWSGAASEILLPDVAPSSTDVVVWMSNGGRPATAPAPNVIVSVDGTVLGAARPDDDVRPYRFDLSPAVAARLASREEPAVLNIDVSTWNPMALLGVDDPRDLGVMVTRVQVR